MPGWTRDLVGFHHLARTTDQLLLVRGAALRASIELHRAYPDAAPDEQDAAAMKAIREAGGIWGLPTIGDTLDEPMQVWMAWVAIYNRERAQSGKYPYRESATEEAMRHDFLFYLHTIRQDLRELARGCLAGHPNLEVNWLAELHHALVGNAGWSVAELVTHVMALHRREFPHCVRTDAELIAHVANYTSALEPLIVDED